MYFLSSNFVIFSWVEKFIKLYSLSMLNNIFLFLFFSPKSNSNKVILKSFSRFLITSFDTNFIKIKTFQENKESSKFNIFFKFILSLFSILIK